MVATATKGGRLTAIGGEVPTNGAVETIEFSQPYVATAIIEGTADILFHAWNCESVDAKSKAAKGSKAKKTDDIESYVYRNDKRHICVPGNYVTGSIVGAAKFRQDPRSPRKSAMDLYKAGVIPLTALAPIIPTGGTDPVSAWDYEHKCRVTVQRNGVTRTRPAFKSGWRVEFQVMVNLPEYIRPADLQDVLVNAGKLIGLADYRPTYGRFQIVSFQVGLE